MSKIPNPNEYLFISDVDYDSYAGKVDSEELYKQMKSMLVCDQCRRIWIFWNGFKNDPEAYLPDWTTT